MKQRVGIARALSMEPKVLLLDEPFGALDALTRAKLQDELLQIVAKTHSTVVMVTHDVDEAVLLGDQVAVLRGRPARLEGWSQARLSRARRRRIAAVAAGEPAGAGEEPAGAARERRDDSGVSRSDLEAASTAAAGLRRALLDERRAS
jgi:ABC-type taurine transport system ATPase subunit